MKLKGEKTIVRKLQRSDIHLMVKWKNDAEIADLVRGAPINTTYELESRRYYAGLEDKDTARFIFETFEGKPIGFLTLGEIDRENRKAELGMFIGEKDYWAKGYGTDCLRVILSYLFNELDFNRVGLEVFEYNERAKKAYLKLGFIVEGVQRQGLYRNNRYFDIYYMGILKDDFIKKHQKLKDF